MQSLKNFIKDKFSKKNSLNDINKLLNELSETNNKYLKTNITSLASSLHDENTKIYNILDKLDNINKKEFSENIKKYLNNKIAINIINTTNKSLCCFNSYTLLLDINNKISYYKDIFKSSTFDNYVSADFEDEDPDDPENTGEGHFSQSSKFGDKNWTNDFMIEVSRKDIVQNIIEIVFEQCDNILSNNEKQMIKKILNDKNTYIIFSNNS